MRRMQDLTKRRVDDSALPPPDFKDFDSVLAKFEKYDFRDKIGHPLTNCADFICLVKMAMEH